LISFTFFNESEYFIITTFTANIGKEPLFYYTKIKIFALKTGEEPLFYYAKIKLFFIFALKNKKMILNRYTNLKKEEQCSIL